MEEYYPVVNVAGVKTVKYTKMLVNSDRNPYDRVWEEYFNDRRVEKSQLFYDSQAVIKHLLRKQKGRCPVCTHIIDLEDKIETDHINPISKGGAHQKANMRVAH